MRAKLSYKSKRNIVIALIIMVLFAASVTTTYFFIKGNQDSSAAFTGNDSQTSENTPVQGSTEGENNPDGNGEVVVPNVNDNNSENPTTTPEENQTTTRPNTQIGQNGVTGNGTATTTQTTGNVPNREYVTERTEQETVLVGENYAVAWAPLSIEANTTTSGRSIVRPEITAVKTASKEDVKVGEELVYTITATNNGKEDGSVVVKDTIPAGTTFVEGSIKVNEENSTYTAEDLANGITIDVTKNGGASTVSFSVIINKKNNNENVKSIKNIAIVGEEETETVETKVANITTVKTSKGSKGTLHELDTITYKLTSTNNGDGKGTVKVADQVPAGTTLVGNVTLTEDDKEYTEQELNDGIDVTLLPGEEKTITFTVRVNPFRDEKVEIKNEVATQDGETITPGTTDVVVKQYASVSVNKVFVDKENVDKLRPETVKVGLFVNENEEPINTVELNAENDWKYTFEKLDKYNSENEELNNYSVKEIDVDENYNDTYKVTTTENSTKVEITNTLKYENVKTNLTVFKIWDDDSNKAGVRPESVEFELIADKVKTGVKLTANKDNTWAVVFEDVNKYKANGDEIAYTVAETSYSKYYIVEIGNNVNGTIKVTNHIDYSLIKTSVTVTKVWEDDNKKADVRPTTITFELLADGVTTGKKLEAKATNNWTVKFDNLNKYTADGKEIKYKVEEEQVKYYQVPQYSDIKDGKITVTNTIDEEAIKTTCKVRYYLENVNGEYIYTATRDVNVPVKFGDIITNYEEQDTQRVNLEANGYTFNHLVYGKNENNTSLKITTNENTNVIDIYYVRQTFDYKVEYYQNSLDSEPINTEISTNQYRFGTKIDEKTVESDLGLNWVNKYIAPGYQEGKVQGYITIEKDSENVIKVLYMPRTDLSYTVNYLEQGTNNKLAEPKTVDKQTFGTSVTEEAIDITGYSKVEPIEEKITIGAEENVINFYYTINTHKITYKIVGDYFTDNSYAEETYNYRATITPVAEPEAKEGYTFSGWSEIPETMPDEDIVVTGSYTINTHKITYKIVGDYFTDDSYAEETYNYGAPVAPVAEPEAKEGYTFSGWSTIPTTMPDEDVVVTGRYTKMPDPSLEFTKIALNSNKQKITEFVYTPNGNNSFYYRLKLENTVANSYPVAVAKQVVTDTLPEGIELDTSNTLPEGVTAATEKGRTTLTWTATNIGKGNNAKYVDIKVKANEQVFKAEEKTETNQTLFSDINPSVVGDANIGSIDDKNNTAGLFIRFAEPTSGNKGYIYAGNVKNVNVSSVPTKVGNYDDTKINSIVSDTSKNKDMFDAFITANNKGGTIYNCLNGKLPSRENIKTYLLDTYNITLKDTQIVLWYQVVEASGEKSRTRTYSLENTKTNTTTNYDVDMPACSYHIDGMIVDISSLRTIPAGTMVPVTNTANATIAINGATQATTATATVSFYYKNK